MKSTYHSSDLISDNTFFVVIDSKDCRKICYPKMGVVKLIKHDINLKKFVGKSLNSFWEFNPETKGFDEITSKEFYKEELSKSKLNNC